MRRLMGIAAVTLATLAGLALLAATATPAWAADCPRVSKAGLCLSDSEHPSLPPDAPGPAGTRNARASGDAGACRNKGRGIPCTKDGFTWMSSPTGGCYGTVADKPPAGDPLWEGHNPSEGNIVYCPLDGLSQVMFFVPTGQATVVDAAAVAERLLARAPFEVADLQMAPPYGFHTYIHVENWFWIPLGQWHDVSITEDIGPASVTLTATPSKFEVEMGDGSSRTCRDAGRVWRKGMTGAAKTSCGNAYEKVSTVDAAGNYDASGRFTAVGRLYYDVSWTCTGRCSAPAGDLGEHAAPDGESHEVEVRQRQTVVTN
jgi:hypothetical protein